MHRKGILFVLVAAVAIVLAVTSISSATGGPWSQLNATILAVVPPGPAQAELLAAADAIDYADAQGTWVDLLNAYDAFVDLIAGHFDAGNLDQVQADQVLGSWQDVSEDKKVEVVREVRVGIELFKNCDFSDCTVDGRVCITFKWKYRDEQGQTGGGQNCFGR